MAKLVKSIKKRQMRRAACITGGLMLWLAGNVFALPTGGQITTGQGAIAQTASKLTVNQVTDRLSLNWNSFSIGAGETVRFIQPSTQAIAVNQVIGANISEIYGQLNANGKVFLLNPNGILIGQGAQVQVGGFVGSSLGMTVGLNGEGIFSNSGAAGMVINNGMIKANGGYVALLAPQVHNGGTLQANNGAIALGAGDNITVALTDDGRLNMVINQGNALAGLTHSGIITANGGQVVLAALNDISHAVVNVDGLVEAKTIGANQGYIQINGGKSGIITVTNKLSTAGKAAGETGGAIEIQGKKVDLASVVDASGDAGGGSIFIDAKKIRVQHGAKLKADAITDGNGGNVYLRAAKLKMNGRISASGGAHGGNGGWVQTTGRRELTVNGKVDASASQGENGAWLLTSNSIIIDDSKDYVNSDALGLALDGANVTVRAKTGDIAVNGIIMKESDAESTLKLQAANSILVKNDIHEYGNGKLNIVLHSDYDQSGAGAISITQTNGVQTALYSNGGDIILGGGAKDGQGRPAGYAAGTATNPHGIYLQGVRLESGDGSIWLKGAGLDSQGSGVFIDYYRPVGGNPDADVDSRIFAGGNITIDGKTQGTFMAEGAYIAGVRNHGSIITEGAGAIDISGAIEGTFRGENATYAGIINGNEIQTYGSSGISLKGAINGNFYGEGNALVNAGIINYRYIRAEGSGNIQLKGDAVGDIATNGVAGIRIDNNSGVIAKQGNIQLQGTVTGNFAPNDIPWAYSATAGVASNGSISAYSAQSALTITGKVTGTANWTSGVYTDGSIRAGTVNLAGEVQGNGHSAAGVSLGPNGAIWPDSAVNITGRVIGDGNYAKGIDNSNHISSFGEGTLEITGEVSGSGSYSFGLYNQGTIGVYGSPVDITGTVQGDGSANTGIYNAGTIIGVGGSVIGTVTGAGSDNRGIVVAGNYANMRFNDSATVQGTVHGSGSGNRGIELGGPDNINGRIENEGEGILTVHGLVEGEDSNNQGIAVLDGGFTNKANIVGTVNGGGSNNRGVYVGQKGWLQTIIGPGDISITGQVSDASRNGYGVYLEKGSAIWMSKGDLFVYGRGLNSNQAIYLEGMVQGYNWLDNMYKNLNFIGKGNVILDYPRQPADQIWGKDIVFSVENGKFLNQAGADVFKTAPDGRWFIYAPTPFNVQKGGLAGKSLSGYSYSVNPPETISRSLGNAFLYNARSISDIISEPTKGSYTGALTNAQQPAALHREPQLERSGNQDRLPKELQ